MRWGSSRRLWCPNSMAEGKPFRAAGENIRPAGASGGVHKHESDEKDYIVLSGSGLYTNKDGEKIRLKAGDVTFCYDGEIHGMENDGDEPLLMAGIIAK